MLQHRLFFYNKALFSQNYYRLKQIDYDGKFDYSPVRIIYFGHKNSLIIAPTQATDQILVSFDNALTEEAKWEIYTLEGRIVKSGTFEENTESQNLETYDLIAGNYFLKVVSGNHLITERFIKL
jgi:hypothetical protein